MACDSRGTRAVSEHPARKMVRVAWSFKLAYLISLPIPETHYHSEQSCEHSRFRMSAMSVTSTPLFIDAVRKRFGAVTAVDGVSLEILPGTCFGLLGPNGAGKSTLIRSIMGRVRPDSGGIRIFGHPVSSAAARADLGWVPQELALYPLLTCRENLHAFGRYQGLRGEALDNAIDWCLEWAALADRARSPVKTLSGGMKRRLNMAAGLIHRPRPFCSTSPR